MSDAIVHIVDDDEAIRDALSWLLRSRGVSAKTWESGEAFLAGLAGDMRGCIVLDIRMDGMSVTVLIGTLGVRFVWENGLHYALFTALGLSVGDVPEGPVTPDLEMPTWIAYSAVPLGSYLMCFRFLQVMWSFFRTNELPHHDHAHVEGVEEEPVKAAPPVLEPAISQVQRGAL